MWLVTFFATASRRAASGNNNRLSTLWREVISLAGVAGSLSKASSYRNLQCQNRYAENDARMKSRRIELQSNDAIEVVASLGGGISEITLCPDAAAVLAGAAGVLMEPGLIFHTAGRALSSLESDVALFVRRIEIPVFGRDGEIAGVLCRDSPLSSASRSTPMTQDQHTAIIGEAVKAILHDITNTLSTIKCGLWLLERQTEVEGR
jgi:hypothetical protein